MLFQSRFSLVLAAGVGACAGVWVFAVPAMASAAEIGIQFYGAQTALPSTQAAGVVSQDNWNTESANINTAGATGLLDSGGNTVANLNVA